MCDLLHEIHYDKIIESLYNIFIKLLKIKFNLIVIYIMFRD